MRSAHNICSRANIRSCILLLSFYYGQGLTVDNCSFSGNMVKKFCPGYYWRWISNDLAFRQFDIFPALSVYWTSDKRNVWTSCKKTKQFKQLMFTGVWSRALSGSASFKSKTLSNARSKHSSYLYVLNVFMRFVLGCKIAFFYKAHYIHTHTHIHCLQVAITYVTWRRIMRLSPGGSTRDFKWRGWSNGARSQGPKKSLGLPAKPKKIPGTTGQCRLLYNTCDVKRHHS